MFVFILNIIHVFGSFSHILLSHHSSLILFQKKYRLISHIILNKTLIIPMTRRQFYSIFILDCLHHSLWLDFARLHCCCIPSRSHLSTLSTFNIAGEDTEFKRHQSGKKHLPSSDVVTEDEKIKLLGSSNALFRD